MGQYYKVVNLDKKEWLHPHKFNDGMKLLEFGCSADGTMTGLAILLAEGNGRGGGDLYSENPIIGSWSRDRIAIVGDYADDEKESVKNIFSMSEGDDWKDISLEVLNAMLDDQYIKQTYNKEK